MNNEIVNAMEELENWLADPAELGPVSYTHLRAHET